ncbi:hypothetical protein [Dactylosporangium sp. NPDC048998]|uniref:hypothetical protein n=1 Tax=Dactylosporangium sp. NPDC048998 TaxID=3363976 RepID=UPI00371FBE97
MTSINGWVYEDNLIRFLAQLSYYIGYQYDELDEAALTGALEQTDDESADAWFSYPLAGTRYLTVSLARAVGGSEVSVRVDGDIDPILSARIETLFDLL